MLGTEVQEPEQARLAALERYGILDTASETRFDEIAVLASQICDAPMAVVVFIDDHRAWFKASIGLPVSEIPRDLAFCNETIRRRATLVLPDALNDPQFADNPLVRDGLGLRFYAGTPLITSDGHAIGTLCVLDQKPRELAEAQVRALDILRSQVMTQLELRRLLEEARLQSEELEQRVRERTRAVYDENARRCSAETELRALASRLVCVQEQERTRLARDVHDNLGQQLTGMAIEIHQLLHLENQSEGARERLLAVNEAVSEAIASVRRIATELRPAVLDDLGLAPALRGELERFRKRTGIETSLQFDELLAPSAHVATVVFRILQEALTNVVRHAHAQHVAVDIERDDGGLVMTVRDDGVGIEQTRITQRTSLGLIGMRERALQLSGTIAFERLSEGGTLLRLRLPRENAAA